ncbi:MAG TPA: hypothetical protein VE398_14085 [Acidobacteriota bacterium]|nr:hypothetical protein [Acidobacteriota bacterium]
MKMDELDRILSSDQMLTPSSDFESRVMKRILVEAASPSIRFPWTLFALSLTVQAFLAGLAARTDIVYRANHLLWKKIDIWITALSDPALQIAALMAVTSIVGTFLLVWGSLRLTGARD